jgi:hypothetical protein
MPDAHANFAYSLVATAPSPATSGTSLVVTAADGAKFPAAPFNAVIWPTASQPLGSNAEIVRVTALSTDTLTIARAQEGTSARTVVVGDQIMAAITAKTLTDVEYMKTGASTLYLKEDFCSGNNVAGGIGELGWQTSNGTNLAIASEANHPGIFQRSSAAVANVVAELWLGGGTGLFVNFDPSTMFDMTWIVRPNVLDAETLIRFGFLFTVAGNPPTNGIYIERSTADTDFFGVTRSGAAQTRTAGLTGGALTATAWYRLRIRRVDASTIGFTVNANAEVLATASIPTALMYACSQVYYNTGGTLGAKTVDYDFFDLLVTGLTR